MSRTETALKHDLIPTATEMYLPNFISAPWLLLSSKLRRSPSHRTAKGRQAEGDTELFSSLNIRATYGTACHLTGDREQPCSFLSSRWQQISKEKKY